MAMAIVSVRFEISQIKLTFIGLQALFLLFLLLFNLEVVDCRLLLVDGPRAHLPLLVPLCLSNYPLPFTVVNV